MAIVKSGSKDGALERRPGSAIAKKAAKKAAKHAAKHAAKKHALKHAAKHALKHAEKHPAKHAEKHAAKHAHDPVMHGLDEDGNGKAGEELAKAFHHLQRAGAVLSLMGQESGGDLKALYELGVEQYLLAAEAGAKKHRARAAQGVLRAVEHLSLGGLYSVRSGFLVKVPVPAGGGSAKHLGKLRARLDRVHVEGNGMVAKVQAAAWELLRRAEGASHDMHLEHELIKAADGLCSALEEKL